MPKKKTYKSKEILSRDGMKEHRTRNPMACRKHIP